MGCNLDKFTTYSVGRVVQDDTGVTAQIVNPPKSCPDGSYHHKLAEIKIVSGTYPTLVYDAGARHAVITVPKKDYVEDVRATGFGTILLWTLVIVAAIVAVWLVVKWLLGDSDDSETTEEKPTPPHARATEASASKSYTYTADTTKAAPSTPPSTHHTTIIQQTPGLSVGDLATGMVLGHILSENNRPTERVVEREIVREPAVSYREEPSFKSDSDDDDDKGSSFSSDSSSSSSYGSDDSGSSSYGSDSSSSSDFSSDSGGSDSFSSDS